MKHFALTSNNGTFVFGVGKFHSLQQLVDHFQNYPIIGGETGLLVEHICICIYWFSKISKPVVNTPYIVSRNFYWEVIWEVKL